MFYMCQVKYLEFVLYLIYDSKHILKKPADIIYAGYVVNVYQSFEFLRL